MLTCSKAATDSAHDSFEEARNLDSDLSQLVTQIRDSNQLSPAGGGAGGNSNDAAASGRGAGGGSGNGVAPLIDVSKCSRHKQYCYHFPLPAATSSSSAANAAAAGDSAEAAATEAASMGHPSSAWTSHESNQRQVLLFGAGKGRNGAFYLHGT